MGTYKSLLSYMYDCPQGYACILLQRLMGKYRERGVSEQLKRIGIKKINSEKCGRLNSENISEYYEYTKERHKNTAN